VTSVYMMQDWARGRARGWAQHRSEAWFPSPDAMRCSFLGSGQWRQREFKVGGTNHRMGWVWEGTEANWWLAE